MLASASVSRKLSRLIKHAMGDGCTYFCWCKVGRSIIQNYSGLHLCSCKVYYQDWINSCKLPVKLQAMSKEIYTFSFISYVKGEAGVFPPTEVVIVKTRLNHFPKQVEYTYVSFQENKSYPA